MLGKNKKIILALSIPLGLLTILVSLTGLLSSNLYSVETPNWRAQSIGQDMIDLFLVVPCLFTSAILAFKKGKFSFLIWGGVVIYLTYTFTLYCFDLHFNKLFAVYCFCLGISFYSSLYFLFTIRNNNRQDIESSKLLRLVGIYFISISVLFTYLWLSEIITSITNNVIPKSLSDTGLFTNGVQVIDLSVILPGIFISGVLILKRKTFGIQLSPAFLTFFILMDITIGFLVIVMKLLGLESNLSITIGMSFLMLLSMVLLIWVSKFLYPKEQKSNIIQK